MKKTKLVWYLLTFVPIVLLVLGYVFPSRFFENQEAIRTYLNRFGAYSPIAFVILQIFQVVVTPFSHYVVSIAGGFMFGTWRGFVLNWIGRVIGTTIAFYLGREYGRKIVKHVVKPSTLKKYDYYFDKAKLLLFLAYFLPLFPDDELSYLAGFSTISPWIFIPLVVIGHIPGSLHLAYIGSGAMLSKDPLFIIISTVVLIAGVCFVWNYRQIKRPKSEKT